MFSNYDDGIFKDSVSTTQNYGLINNEDKIARNFCNWIRVLSYFWHSVQMSYINAIKT